jgi:hypothetical protein
MTIPTIDPTVDVSFDSKAPHDTFWVTVYYPAANPPTELFAAFADAGFKPDGLAELPPLDGRCETRLFKRGTALFAGWTPAEAKQNGRLAHAICKRFALFKPMRQRLSYRDLG